MACRHLAAHHAGCDGAFTVDASRVTFGAGSLREVGDRARALGMRRVALITDTRLRALPWFEEVRASLTAAGLDADVFDEVAIEPTDASLDSAVRFARDVRPDGFVSLGGGSVIDTAKIAALLFAHPAPLRAYVNAPVGEGRAVPGPLAPHVACPTTSGTGSEVTGIAIFDDLALHAKTGVASPRLRPSEAIVDPRTTATLPANVVAASGMDVLCHAIESFTARRYTQRAAPASPTARPMSQGGNPWSDLGCREALRIANAFLVRAVADASDAEAREQMMWAATLAGIAFGNAGVHAPHAMAYAIAGVVHESAGRADRARLHFAPSGYPSAPIVPHGMAVGVGAPAVFRAFAAFAPVRHLEAAALLGAEVRGAGTSDAGDLLAGAVIRLSRAIGFPDGTSGVGYTADDTAALVDGTLPQQRLLANAPCEVDRECLEQLFAAALRYEEDSAR
jgi:hydroxyacid-oxoacid transhydrogenase